MRVYKFSPPYRDNGKTAYPETANKSGVYIIKKAGEIVYVGYSASNIYKTMYRHFQTWNDNRQVRVVYKKISDITVRVILCGAQQAKRLEAYLILKYKPKDNPNKYEGFEPDYKEEDEWIRYKETPVEDLPF